MGGAPPSRVAAAMCSPGFYPGPPAEVRLVETHVSWVFLAGDRAYKLRKPVVLPFLDFGTAERRRAACEAEVRVGRRLAPSVYVGVRSVVERDGRLALDEPSAAGALEHVTEMRRFDERETLAARLEDGAASTSEVRRVARRVAEFHAGAEVVEDAFAAAHVAGVTGDNFEALLTHAPFLGAARLAAGHRFAVAFPHGRRALIDSRAASGRVRDCHGDLRAEHVLLGDEVEVFDPIEFDPALRRIDVLADVAFLAMELMAADREDLADAFVGEYRAAAGEGGREADRLLWFYAAYRAWVRAKVACLRAAAMGGGEGRDAELATARRLAALGGRLAWRARRPVVLVICGGAATGKTHLSRALAEASGLPHLESDAVRKRLAGLDPSERAPDREYSDEASRRTYAELGVRAAESPAGAIVDATFRRREHRDAFGEAYGNREPAPLFVECRAPAATVVEWARGRVDEPGRVSDATPEIAERTLSELEPLDEVPAGDHVAIRTDRPVGEAVDDVEAALDARLAREGGGAIANRMTKPDPSPERL